MSVNFVSKIDVQQILLQVKVDFKSLNLLDPRSFMVIYHL